MAGYNNYNRKRYYTKNRDTDTAGDYFKRILKQNAEIELLKAENELLRKEIADWQRTVRALEEKDND